VQEERYTFVNQPRPAGTFTYTDHEFNEEFLHFMQECMETYRERAQEYNNAAASTSMLEYFEPDVVIPNHFAACYMYVKHKFSRFANCLKNYIAKVELVADTRVSYERAEDSIRDLVNYAAFEAVILRLHYKWVQSQLRTPQAIYDQAPEIDVDQQVPVVNGHH